MCEIIRCRGAYYAPAGGYYARLRNPCQQKHTFFETRNKKQANALEKYRIIVAGHCIQTYSQRLRRLNFLFDNLILTCDND